MSLDFEYLGPYKVQRLLGRGGMGSVYLGQHSNSGDSVAIKVLAQSIANQPRFRRRFASEIDALKRLRHPNIVSLIGYGEEDGLLFYVMEFVPGQSVHDLIRSKKQLPWQDAVQIAIDTSAALKHAHNIGIIHRDLKPANLLVDKVGATKLTDFGIAKLYGATGETAVGSVIGTADYMPPEQAEGKTITARSDLYSLGSVLFALLTGKPPFHGKSVPEVLYSVRYNPIPDLQEFGLDAPDELIELVKQLLEKDPQRRPPTALVVGNRLKSIQQALKGTSSISGDPSSQPSSAEPTQSTRIGNKLTSVDMSDDEMEQVVRSHGTSREADSPPSYETSSGKGLGTHERQTVVAPLSPESPGQLTDAGNPDESDLSSEHFTSPNKTKNEHTGATNASMPHSSVTSGGPSHYTPVTEDTATNYTSVGSPARQHNRTDKLHIASTLGLIALLVGSIALVWWKLQPESADELYQQIVLAVESGDESQLFSANHTMSVFLDLYPDDERASEVQAMADEVELIRRVRLLERRASRSSGIHEMSAAEQGFLESMRARSNDHSLGQEKLAAFIALFGSSQLEPSDARLVELAKFAKDAGTLIVLDKELEAKSQLAKLIQSAEQTKSGEQLEQFYSNLLTLYEDKPWAHEQIEKVKQKMKK